MPDLLMIRVDFIVDMGRTRTKSTAGTQKALLAEHGHLLHGIYVSMFLAPGAAGGLAARLGGPSAAFDFGAVVLLATVLLAWVFPLRGVSAPAAGRPIPRAAQP